MTRATERRKVSAGHPRAQMVKGVSASPRTTRITSSDLDAVGTVIVQQAVVATLHGSGGASAAVLDVGLRASEVQMWVPGQASRRGRPAASDTAPRG